MDVRLTMNKIQKVLEKIWGNYRNDIELFEMPDQNLCQPLLCRNNTIMYAKSISTGDCRILTSDNCEEQLKDMFDLYCESFIGTS